MTQAHNKLKKEMQEQNKRPKILSLKALSKLEWQRSRDKARAKRRNHVVIKV